MSCLRFLFSTLADYSPAAVPTPREIDCTGKETIALWIRLIGYWYTCLFEAASEQESALIIRDFGTIKMQIARTHGETDGRNHFPLLH